MADVFLNFIDEWGYFAVALLMGLENACVPIPSELILGFAGYLIYAERIAKRNLPAAVIDTENGFVKLGLAKKLAKKMEASYFRVDKLSEDSLLRVWRKMSR